VKKVTGPTPISAVSKQKQLNPILFDNVLTLMLNDSGETAHPIVEDALHVIKSEMIPLFCNCGRDFVTRRKLAILQDSFQHSKKPKVTRNSTMVDERRADKPLQAPAAQAREVTLENENIRIIRDDPRGLSQAARDLGD
jgi:hypothetical protein